MTRVLRDCPAHAAAFSPAVLQHVRWATTASEQLAAAIASLTSLDNPGATFELLSQVRQYRSRALGEINAIEQELRQFVPPAQ
jgi:hypothetical protein